MHRKKHGLPRTTMPIFKAEALGASVFSCAIKVRHWVSLTPITDNGFQTADAADFRICTRLI